MRVWDYPFEIVNIRCDACGRKGRYSKARFLALVGRSTALPGALRIIARDCPHKGEVQDRCGAYYPDLRCRPDNGGGR